MTDRTVPRSPLRRRVESASRPALVRLHALPRPLVPLLTVVLVAVGLLAPLALGLVALAVVLAFVAWIAFLSWPAVPLSGRLMRLLMLGLVVAMAFLRS